MKIESGRSVTSAGGAKRAGGAAAPGFSPDVDEPQRATATAPTSAVTPLDALLALQGDEPGQRRSRQARRGQDALDTLEELAAGLLLGRAPASKPCAEPGNRPARRGWMPSYKKLTSDSR